MNVELGHERLILHKDRITAEDAEQKAWAKRMDAFGTLAKMSGLLAKPKDEEFELVYRERRLQPFWRLVCTATYVYERTRDYTVKLAPEVKAVTLEGTERTIREGAFVVTGIESCREEARREALFDGLTKAEAPELAAYLSMPSQTLEPEALAAAAGEGAIVLPPQIKASQLSRELVAGLIRRIEADRVLQEIMSLEVIDLHYRPVHAFRYRRQNKEAVVEVDALTGVAKPGGTTFEQHLGKILEPRFLLEVGAEAANFFIPGANLAKILVVKGMEMREAKKT